MEKTLELLERVTEQYPPPPGMNHSLIVNEMGQLVLCFILPNVPLEVSPRYTFDANDLSLKPYELMAEIERFFSGPV